MKSFEEVRVHVARLDAEGRRSRGEPIPERIQRLLSRLVAEATESGEIVDIYQAAGMPKPSVMDLRPDFACANRPGTPGGHATRHQDGLDGTR